MLKGILEYVGIMNHTIKKESVVKSLDFILANIDNDVIPALTAVIDSNDIKVIIDSSILNNIGNMCDIKHKNNIDVLVKIKQLFVSISDNRKELYNLVNVELNDIVTDKTITAKDGAILKVISDIASINIYVLDLVYLVLIDNSDTDLPKIRLKRIRDTMPSFVGMYKVYSEDFSKLLENISKISNTVIDINDGNSSMTNMLLAKTGKRVTLPGASGFINNPIYHVRLWFVDREVKKYESLKEKKRLIELKLMELKLEQTNTYDQTLRKQVEYYENKLSTIEYKIEKIEQD